MAKKNKNGPKILHLDVETAPHLAMAWGLFNQTIRINQIKEPGYTLCWSAAWDHNRRTIYFRSRYDEDFLSFLWELIDEADALCTYNGVRFDIPVINREFLEAGLTPPSPSKNLDLYKVVKQNFRFASNKLDFVCQMLGIGAKIHHKGQELWTGCMEGDEKSWRLMARYNRQDVRLLPKLYDRLLPWISGHPNHALYSSDNRPLCSNCGSGRVQSRGTEKTRTMVYRRFVCTDCGKWLRSRLSERSENPIIVGA